MSSKTRSMALWMNLACLFPFVAITSGCQSDNIEPLAVNCNEAIVADESYQLQLLEYSEKENALITKSVATPNNRVVITGRFDCRSGKILYTTWDMGTASAKAELHIRGANGEHVQMLHKGMNALLPIEGEPYYLIETAAITREKYDPAFGDLSDEEIPGGIMPMRLAERAAFEKKPITEQVLVDDVVFDPATEKEVRHQRGTMGRRQIIDGKMYAFAMDHTIYEFNPLNGHRKRVHDYRDAKYIPFVSPTTLPWPEFRLPGKDGQLYGVAGSKQNESRTANMNLKNSINRWDAGKRTWVQELPLNFDVEWASSDTGKLIIFGRHNVAIYDPISKQLEEQAFEVGDYDLRSLVRLSNKWALSLDVPRPGNPGKYQESQIWIIDHDFKKIALKHVVKNVRMLRLNSVQTPTPAKW